MLGIDEGTQRQEAETQVLVARREVDRRKDLADQAARAVRRAKEAFDEVSRGPKKNLYLVCKYLHILIVMKIKRSVR